MRRTVTFKVKKDILEKLDKYAMSKGLSRSEVIRKAIEEFLKTAGQN